jgi:RNA processing factor Prp31
MDTHLKQTIAIVLLFILLFFGVYSLLNRSEDTPSVEPIKTEIREDKSKAVILEKYYKQQMAIQKYRSDSIEALLKVSNEKLRIANFKLHQSEFETVRLARKETSHQSIPEQLADRDSLKIQAIQFVAQVDSTVNTYDTALLELKSLIAVKDSEVVICNKSFAEMKTLMDQNLAREQKLTEDLQKSYKQQKRKTIQNKILAAGAFILSGITTTLFYVSRK